MLLDLSGALYTSHDYQDLLTWYGKVQIVSMSRKGNSWDAAPIESFWGTLKTECATHLFDTHQQAHTAIFTYIIGFYNQRQLHSSLDYLSPIQFEQLYFDQENPRRFYCPN